MTCSDTQRLRSVALAVAPITRDVLPMPQPAAGPDAQHCAHDGAASIPLASTRGAIEIAP
ncbi:hypothetical protein BJD12_09455 [Xanthomonas vesicatoria ATCC 35937]|uniref:Uncharacterized protein n=1 Tax=Xanthomonas vesicatoria ATCC 35937 TaxID=925775 RepID=F0B7V3_9XANT|nr:hypothetical protein BJD12_09455 [Xanthomonas vesicatoria ATCC 35937]EGD11639.1 hypothetical protein XVE_0147 [Xanthomonas vesicatoria ATCC 35937]KTF30765.1 hypothetical protein LMG919_20600 [Xanthomonas vesicatoria]KTF31555.1 hypothetical protein LMG920_15790 [Xanthomonas vesicatoria]